MSALRDTRWNWRRHPTSYFNEQRLAAILVSCALLCMAVRQVNSMAAYVSALTGVRRPMWSVIADAIGYVLTDPNMLLWTAAFYVVTRRAILGNSTWTKAQYEAPAELPPGLFAVIWLARCRNRCHGSADLCSFGFRLILKLVALAGMKTGRFPISAARLARMQHSAVRQTPRAPAKRCPAGPPP